MGKFWKYSSIWIPKCEQKIQLFCDLPKARDGQYNLILIFSPYCYEVNLPDIACLILPQLVIFTRLMR
jgi:hypothetical protein